MNEGRTKTLELLKSEKDLIEERKRSGEIKKKIGDLNLAYWMTGMNEKRIERFWKVVTLLQENSRMSLCEMSRKLKIPVSTLFDILKEVEKIFKFTTVIRTKREMSDSGHPLVSLNKCFNRHRRRKYRSSIATYQIRTTHNW